MVADTYPVCRLCSEDNCNKYSSTEGGKYYLEFDVSMPAYFELLMDFYEDLGLRADHSGQKTLLFVSNKTKVVVIHDNNVDVSPDKTWSDSRNFVDGRTIQK